MNRVVFGCHQDWYCYHGLIYFPSPSFVWIFRWQSKYFMPWTVLKWQVGWQQLNVLSRKVVVCCFDSEGRAMTGTFWVSPLSVEGPVGLEHHHLLPKSMLPLPMGPLRQALVRRLQLLWAVVLGLGLLALRRGVRIGPPRRVPTSGLLYITTSWSLETTPTSAPPPEQAQSRKILFLIEKTFPAKVSVSRFEKQDL